MTRGISASTLTALENDNADPIIFVEVHSGSDSSATVDYLHTGLGTITWGGNDWTGTGTIATFDEIPEGVGLSPRAIRVGLSGVDSDVTDLVFGAEYYRRPCKIYLGALSDGALVEDPSIIFSGFNEALEMVIADDDGDTVMLTAESELVLFRRSREIRYTDARLQSEYPGDKGFEFMPQVANAKVVWRGDKQSALGLGGGRTEGGVRRGAGGRQTRARSR